MPTLPLRPSTHIILHFKMKFLFLIPLSLFLSTNALENGLAR
jgi:hypothetical protein